MILIVRFMHLKLSCCTNTKRNNFSLRQIQNNHLWISSHIRRPSFPYFRQSPWTKTFKKYPKMTLGSAVLLLKAVLGLLFRSNRKRSPNTHHIKEIEKDCQKLLKLRNGYIKWPPKPSPNNVTWRITQAYVTQQAQTHFRYIFARLSVLWCVQFITTLIQTNFDLLHGDSTLLNKHLVSRFVRRN